MTIPVHLELSKQSRRWRSRLARFYLEHERGAIAGCTLVILLLVWEAIGASGLVDPLFISSPTGVARAAWRLSQRRDFWTDLQVSGTELRHSHGPTAARARADVLACGCTT